MEPPNTGPGPQFLAEVVYNAPDIGSAGNGNRKVKDRDALVRIFLGKGFPTGNNLFLAEIAVNFFNDRGDVRNDFTSSD